MAELRPEHVEAFVRALEGEFYIDEESVASAVTGHTSFNIIHRESMFKVDVFVPVLRPFVREQFTRARKQVFAVEPQVEALVATAEDTLLAKLEMKGTSCNEHTNPRTYFPGPQRSTHQPARHGNQFLGV